MQALRPSTALAGVACLCGVALTKLKLLGSPQSHNPPSARMLLLNSRASLLLVKNLLIRFGRMDNVSQVFGSSLQTQNTEFFQTSRIDSSIQWESKFMFMLGEPKTSASSNHSCKASEYFHFH